MNACKTSSMAVEKMGGKSGSPVSVTCMHSSQSYWMAWDWFTYMLHVSLEEYKGFCLLIPLMLWNLLFKMVFILTLNRCKLIGWVEGWFSEFNRLKMLNSPAQGEKWQMQPCNPVI